MIHKLIRINQNLFLNRHLYIVTNNLVEEFSNRNNTLYPIIQNELAEKRLHQIKINLKLFRIFRTAM